MNMLSRDRLLSWFLSNEYETAHSAFRRKTNESTAVVDSLANALGDARPKEFADLGCGDGELLYALFSPDVASPPGRIHLVDPRPIVAAARRRLILRCEKVVAHQGVLEQVPPSVDNDLDLAISVHSAYGFSELEWQRLLALAARGCRVIIVLCHPDAQPARCWRILQPGLWGMVQSRYAQLCNWPGVATHSVSVTMGAEGGRCYVPPEVLCFFSYGTDIDAESEELIEKSVAEDPRCESTLFVLD